MLGIVTDRVRCRFRMNISSKSITGGTMQIDRMLRDVGGRKGEVRIVRNTAVGRKGKYGDGDEAATLGGRRVVQEIGSQG